MGDPAKMTLDCGDDEPCELDAGKKAGTIEVRIGLRRKDTTATNPLVLERIEAHLVDAKTRAEVPLSAKNLMPNGGVVVSFRAVTQRRHVFNATERNAEGKVAYEVVDEEIQVDASKVDATGAQSLDLELVPRARVTLRITVDVVARGINPQKLEEIIETRRRDPDINVRLKPEGNTRLLDAAQGVYEFEVLANKIYQVIATPSDQLVLPGEGQVHTSASLNELTLELTQRCRVYYITIDSVPDRGHGPNLDGMRRALSSSGQPLYVELKWYAELQGIDTVSTPTSARKPSDVFALFFGGNYDEWAGDAAQARGVTPTKGHKTPPEMREDAKKFVRDTRLPIMSVCGSHQLMAYLWHEIARDEQDKDALKNSWEAIGHIGNPQTIADEILWRQQNPQWKEPHVRGDSDGDIPRQFLSQPSLLPVKRQVGDFRHKLEIAQDPVFSAQEAIGANETVDGQTFLSGHFYDTHRDEVRVVPPQFDRLVTDLMKNEKTWLAGEDVEARKTSSLNQGMRLKPQRGGDRLLYSFQFHPEFFMPNQRPIAPDLFDGQTNDGGKLMHNFLSLARSFWKKKHW